MDDKTEKIVAAVQCKPRQSKHSYFSTYDYFAMVANLLSVLANEDNGLDSDDRHSLCEEALDCIYVLKRGEDI